MAKAPEKLQCFSNKLKARKELKKHINMLGEVVNRFKLVGIWYYVGRSTVYCSTKKLKERITKRIK